MTGRYVIVANVALPDSCLRMGARVVVCSVPGNPESVRVRGLTRGGRRVTKYTRLRGLTNLRAAWEHDPRDEWMMFATKADAERVIAERLTPPGPAPASGSASEK